MARRWFPLVAAAVLLHTILLVSGTKYLVTLPKEPHYDSEVLATVTAIGVPPEGDFIELVYRGAKDSSRLLNKTELEFKKDGVQTWGVVFPWKRIQDLEETGVKFEIGNVDKKLYFNKDTGYIFIQTDKPIYNPRQTVRFRIIAVDEYQQLSKYQLKVDIKNPAGVIVDRMRYSPEEAFTGQTFELPREATHGMWSVSANFEGLDNTYSATKSVEFEVREYVLPRFSAALTADTDAITRDTEWLSLFITGQYVYGRRLQGDVELQLGVWNEEEGLKMLDVGFNGPLKNGKARVNFQLPNKVFPTDKEFPKGSRLYVSVNVTEAGSGENFTIEDTSIAITQPYFKIDFTSADQYFKPGFPYTLKVDLSSMSGKLTPGAYTHYVVIFKDKNGKELKKFKDYMIADEDSKLEKQFDLSEDVDDVDILVGVLDWKRNVFTSSNHYPRKYSTTTNQYLHISMVKDITERRDGTVSLLYTPDNQSTQTPTKITVQVLSKGQVVHTTSAVKNHDGRSNVALPSYLYKVVSPSMRIVAYFHSVLGDETEFVTDSLLVHTPDVCLEEIYLDRPGGYLGSQLPYKPKQKYEMEIEGGPGMRVGLVAVDEAVFILNDRQSLTRQSFFKDMESHDQGEGEGDGDGLEDVLLNSGLQHLIFDTDDEPKEAVAHFHEMLPQGGSHSKLHRGKVATNTGSKMRMKSNRDRKAVPPQTVRKYFPESWLFDEIQLDSTGFKTMDIKLPDSITTWNFLAVGVSKHRGVCVSRPLKQRVEKLFFADVRLPYKVTRLEEVKVKIAIYNYQLHPLEVTGYVSGVEGICFAANSRRGSSQDEHSFAVTVPSKGTVTEVVKIIPLKNGELTLKVDLEGGQDRDVVEKTLFVVAEGRRVHKSITFVLDPEAKHMTYKDPQQQKITVQSSPTINNVFDMTKKEQNTTIDLALPEEVILGTESCHIAAFGDLMGDIINHAVVQSKSLVDQPMAADAEEVLADLGPTVHALLYVNESGLANQELAQKGRRFISHSVARLLKYKEGAFFRLTPKSKPATWLTATVLKTLCYASQLTFIDQENLIDSGFSWLAGRVSPLGMVEELDWRLSEQSLEYDLMLSAEVLIALLDCERVYDEDHLGLMANMAVYLEEYLHMVQQPMVLAKATYALDMFDPRSPRSVKAVNRLWSMRRKNKLGQLYWSDKQMEEGSDSTPFWYQPGAKASSIEATAYALLVMLEQSTQLEYVEAIADWLVGQRNENGAFIGAMDSMAAIQALSRYSLRKREQELLEVDLSCNVSSERVTGKQTHSFKFTQQDATSPKSVNNVPVGQKLEVLTKGQGLGQMHVNVEYNVPVNRNAFCEFNVTVEVKPTIIRWMEDMRSNPMCTTCGIGCDEKVPQHDVEREIRYVDVKKEPMRSPPRPPTKRRPFNSRVSQASTYRRRTPSSSSSSRRGPPPPGFLVDLPVSPASPKRRGPPLLSRPMVQSAKRRTARSVKDHPTASKRSMCIHVCLQYLSKGNSGRTSIEVEMLTGYFPVTPDVDRIANLPGVRYAQFDSNRDVLVVQYDKVPSGEKTCFALRAVDEQEVGRPTPASVVIRQAGQPQPSCSMEYNPPLGEESLQVFCADFSNKNRGECKCFSGICSSCEPMPGPRENIHLNELKTMTCAADVGYEVELAEVVDRNQWVEIDAKVVHRNKTGSHDIESGDSIKLITPSSCSCPLFYFRDGSEKNEKMYLLSPDVEKLVDRRGQAVYRYLLDDQSTFLRVSEQNRPSTGSSKPTVSHMFLKSAFLQQHLCG